VVDVEHPERREFHDCCDHEPMEFAGSTTSALDRVMIRHGFAAGPGGDVQVIYCASHDELSDRFPRLPQANAQPRGVGRCIDLVITDLESGLEVNFEGEPLSDTLRALGLDEAAKSIDELAWAPPTVALSTLVEVLPQLFRASEN
jgi:hypothetical protein